MSCNGCYFFFFFASFCSDVQVFSSPFILLLNLFWLPVNRVFLQKQRAKLYCCDVPREFSPIVIFNSRHTFNHCLIILRLLIQMSFLKKPKTIVCVSVFHAQWLNIVSWLRRTRAGGGALCPKSCLLDFENRSISLASWVTLRPTP